MGCPAQRVVRRRFDRGRSVARCSLRLRVLDLSVCSATQEDDMTNQPQGKLAFTVAWQVRDGEAAASADIIARFVPEARKEPGLELLMVNQCATNPLEFLFYEVFRDAAAFEEHQQTPHFKTLILEQGLPLLSKRERVQWVPL
jgi:quinol monooxygenase YgiN